MSARTHAHGITHTRPMMAWGVHLNAANDPAADRPPESARPADDGRSLLASPWFYLGGAAGVGVWAGIFMLVTAVLR